MTRETIATVVALLLLIVAVVFGTRYSAKELKTETGRYVVYNKKYFEKKPGQMKTMNIPGAEQMEGINGFVIDKPPIEALSSDEWVVQKEYIHHTFPFSCSRCETIPCPTPTPGPTPQPSPNPTPPTGPVEDDKSWGRARVHAKEAMAKVDTSKVKVCIVDTGADLTHPNRGNIVGTKDFTGNGTAQDGNGHGTHTAGTVGGRGGVGISRSALYICKGLDDRGSGSTSSLAQCLSWCGAQGAQIVSNSWGSPQSDPLINQTIAELTAKGIAVVVANGNDGQGRLNWPAALSQTNPLVFGVAASDQNDRKASFSSYGAGTKFIAPGVDIVSNVPGGGTQKNSGTSMSCPHVAGLMAYCVPLKKPFQNCLKSLTKVSGYDLPDALATVQ